MLRTSVTESYVALMEFPCHSRGYTAERLDVTVLKGYCRWITAIAARASEQRIATIHRRRDDPKTVVSVEGNHKLDCLCGMLWISMGWRMLSGMIRLRSES